MLKSPLVNKSVRCPACKKESQQRFFRQRMFVAEVKESDQHVVTYKWLVDDVEKVHPGYYFIYFCSHCGFSDTTEDFAKPPEGLGQGQVLKEYRRSAGGDAVVQALSKAIDYDQIDFEGALCLHLLALRVHSMLDDESLCDAYKLGRICLRIAWLYRERNGPAAESGAAPNAPFQQAAPEGTSKNGALPQNPPQPVDIPEEGGEDLSDFKEDAEAMAAQWEQFTAAWDRMRASIKKRIRDIARAAHLEGPNPYPARLVALNSTFHALGAELARFQEVCDRDVSGGLLRKREPPPQPAVTAAASNSSTAQQEETRPAFVWETIEQFLVELRRLWPEAPVTEREAMLMTVQFFKHALLSDNRFDNAQNHLKVSQLAADLAIRCNDFPAAMEMVRGMYKPAVDERNRLQEKLRKKDNSEIEQRQLQAGMKRVAEAIEHAGDLRREVLQMMVDKEMPRITSIAQETGAKGADLERTLLDRGIFPEVVSELKGRGALPGRTPR